MATEQYTNFGNTTLASAITTSGQTSFDVASTTGFPSVPNFRILVTDGTDVELMLVTGVSSVTYTVTRGYEGTTPLSSASIGSVVKHVFTAASFKQAFIDRPREVTFRAAMIQDDTPSLGFSASTDAPTPVAITGTNNIAAAASFAAGVSNKVYDHFALPADWTGAISVDFKWRTSATTGNCTWQIETAGSSANEGFDVAWNTADTVTTAANGTTNRLTVSNIASISTTGVSAGDELAFRISRSAGDTLAVAAELISVKFTMHKGF